MELVLQTLVVAIVVAASSLYAAWRLTPARTRYRLLSTLNPDTRSPIGRWLAGLKNKAAAELTHGCGACAGGATKKPSLAGRLRTRT